MLITYSMFSDHMGYVRDNIAEIHSRKISVGTVVRGLLHKWTMFFTYLSLSYMLSSKFKALTLLSCWSGRGVSQGGGRGPHPSLGGGLWAGGLHGLWDPAGRRPVEGP